MRVRVRWRGLKTAIYPVPIVLEELGRGWLASSWRGGVGYNHPQVYLLHPLQTVALGNRYRNSRQSVLGQRTWTIQVCCWWTLGSEGGEGLWWSYGYEIIIFQPSLKITRDSTLYQGYVTYFTWPYDILWCRIVSSYDVVLTVLAADDSW